MGEQKGVRFTRFPGIQIVLTVFEQVSGTREEQVSRVCTQVSKYQLFWSNEENDKPFLAVQQRSPVLLLFTEPPRVVQVAGVEFTLFSCSFVYAAKWLRCAVHSVR